MPGREILAKSLEGAGLLIVALALVVGLQTGDSGRELLTLVLGALTFLAGWALEPRRG